MRSTLQYDTMNVSRRYDASRALPHETLELWLDELASTVAARPPGVVVDLGCGTGRFTNGLANRFGRTVGIDPSRSMLAVARQNSTSPAVSFRRGSAEAMPLEATSASLVFLSMVYHHLSEPTRAIEEIARVLCSGGFVAIRTATREDVLENPLFDFFPAAREQELKRMPERGTLRRDVASHGLEVVRCARVRQLFAESHTEYFRKISMKSLSVFHLIPEADFLSGLTALERFCALERADDRVHETFTLLIARKS